jgi:hypothetical protein
MNPRYPLTLIVCVLLLLTPACNRRLPSIARLTLPPASMTQAQLIAYAESPGYARDIAARIPGAQSGNLKVSVRKPRNTDILEVRVFSDLPTVSALAANLGADVLMDFARSNRLGTLQLIDVALPPLR